MKNPKVSISLIVRSLLCLWCCQFSGAFLRVVTTPNHGLGPGRRGHHDAVSSQRRRQQQRSSSPRLALSSRKGGFGAPSTAQKSPKKKQKKTKDKSVAKTTTTTTVRRESESRSPSSSARAESVTHHPSSSTATAATVVYRADYREPAYWVTRVSLDFDIVTDDDDDVVTVTTLLTVQPNPRTLLDDRSLVLDGDAGVVRLKHVAVLHNDDDDDGGDGTSEEETVLRDGTDYDLTSDRLVIRPHVVRHDDDRTTTTTTRIRTVVESKVASRDAQTGELSGLYRRDDHGSTSSSSSSLIMTHCEPTGFRRITYFPDRPDNTAVFERVCIRASQTRYPVLLSNGHRVETGTLPDDRHYAVYRDPHPKPSYVFGLVAARDLVRRTDVYTTGLGGRTVRLNVYSEPSAVDRMAFAVETLKRAMAWEERTYGLQYDLNAYNVVAVRHFVLGAMENKGLNVFQTSLIATRPESTTDVTYDLVEKTVAHEYFHNWSGNRVTVRDWFEFALKEGLTVYRDQEFTADDGISSSSSSRAAKTRIDAVAMLREKQFREDASPRTRHAVRPERASSTRQDELDALASSTTYHKGAEVCRMYKVILGKEGFRKGLRLYMERHDGTGATCDDFRNAMADANHADLDQFALWYSTAGTPTLSYDHSYDEERNVFALTLTQDLEHSPDVVLHIPVAVGLLDKTTGEEVVPTTTLNLKEQTATFEFKDLENDVVPSILRDFSAPVVLVAQNRSKQEEALPFLATYDTDGFNKWEAIQHLYTSYIFKLMRGEDVRIVEGQVFKAFHDTLKEPKIDPSSKSYLLNLPTESILSRQLEVDSPDGVHKARKEASRRIWYELKLEIRELYDELTASMPDGEVHTDASSRATRALRNVMLDFLCSTDDMPENQAEAANLTITHLDSATCLTDRLAAFRKLSSMTGVGAAARDEATEKFYQFAKGNDPIVMHKWFQTQALADLPDVLDRVKALTQHSDFSATNAGRFRSLITSFTLNANAFHCEGGYKFIGSIASQMDAVAPPLAVELANKLAGWQHQDPTRASLMKAELRRIGSAEKVSHALSETIQRALVED